jgi:hypothetical protein
MYIYIIIISITLVSIGRSLGISLRLNLLALLNRKGSGKLLRLLASLI